MDLVLVLIADPAAPSLDEALAERVRRRLAEAGGEAAPPDWLAPGLACDIAFGGLDAKAARSAAVDAIGPAPIDAAVVPRAGRRKRLLVADMDATMVIGETLDALALLAGVAHRVVPITERAMRGEIAFRDAVRERVALLAGQPARIIDQVRGDLAYTPGARALVATMRAHGALCALVSGGFDVFTDHVREALGFDRSAGNRLIVEDSVLTGRVAEPILGRDAKRELLGTMAAELALDPGETCAVGDGANDLPMLLEAGLGVAFRAKPAVRAAAPVAIDHGDLTALLYLQGYPASEIIGGPG